MERENQATRVRAHRWVGIEQFQHYDAPLKFIRYRFLSTPARQKLVCRGPRLSTPVHQKQVDWGPRLSTPVHQKQVDWGPRLSTPVHQKQVDWGPRLWRKAASAFVVLTYSHAGIALALVVLAGVMGLDSRAQTGSQVRLQEMMQNGATAMKSGDFGTAIVDYRAVTRALPQFAEGYFNLGLALERADQLEDAQAALEKALKLKPQLRGANLFLGIMAYRQNRFKDAEESLERETRLDPRNAKAFLWLGICNLAEDHPQEAIAPLDRAYALDSSDADILYHRGRAYLEVANASYARMYQLDHDSMRVHQVLGEAYARSFRTQEAISEFELAVTMAPQHPGLHEELGDQYWVAGQLDKAAPAYREELRIDPYAVSTIYKLGSLEVLNQNAADGIQLLRNALKADPSLSDAHYYLGTGLASLGQDLEAIHEFEQAVAANPKDDRAMTSWYKLAQIYRKLRNSQQAEMAMGNFLRMREETKQRQDQRTAQMIRKRAELPVEDPAKAALEADTRSQ